MGIGEWFRRHPRTTQERFVESPMRDNWYQASAYWPSPFALITTVSETGLTNVAPYQLTLPFEVIGERSFILCSRMGSNTEGNIRRTGVCALNYVEFDRRKLKKIVSLGYPGQTTEEKMPDNPYTLVDSPTPGRAFDGQRFPQILQEAFQVFECRWDKSQPLHEDGRTPQYFVLRIERILMKETWAQNLADGVTRLPRVPLAYGFRDASRFWFAEHKRPFWFPIPENKGPKEENILYEANRLDPEVRFTREACRELTGIPRPFVKTALKGIVKRARNDGISLVDVDYIRQLNEERDGG